jgi:hypothetical protein
MFGTAGHGRTLDCLKIRLALPRQRAVRWRWWLAAATTEAQSEVLCVGV